MNNNKELKNMLDYIYTLRTKPCGKKETYIKMYIIKELTNQLIDKHIGES